MLKLLSPHRALSLSIVRECINYPALTMEKNRVKLILPNVNFIFMAVPFKRLGRVENWKKCRRGRGICDFQIGRGSMIFQLGGGEWAYFFLPVPSPPNLLNGVALVNLFCECLALMIAKGCIIYCLKAL